MGRFLKTPKPGGALHSLFPLGFTGGDDATRQGFTVSATQVLFSGAQLAEMAGLLDSGVIRVAIDSEFSLAAAGKAHDRAANGDKRRKIVFL